MEQVSTTLRALITTVIFAMASDAMASADAGLEVSVGTSTIRITYSASREPTEALNYVRDPSGALFDTILVMQQEYDTVLSKGYRYWIEISEESGKLYVYEDSSADGYDVVKSVPFDENLESMIRNLLCDLLGRTADCANRINEENRIALGVAAEGKSLVLFGSLPSISANAPYRVL